MSLNLASIVDNVCRRTPDEVALIHDEVRYDYRELQARAAAFAAHLECLGVLPGDKVALMAPNRPSFTVAYFGILRAGAVVVPISYLAVAREITHYLTDADTVAFVAWHEYESAARAGFDAVETCRGLFLFDESKGPLHAVDGERVEWSRAREAVSTSSDDTAVILYTSGTTGTPKGAELSHFNLFSNAQYCAERLQSKSGQADTFGPGEVALACLPLFHSFGQTCVQNASLFGGAAISYLERFEPERAFEVLERDRVTMFCGVPTMYQALLYFPGAERFDLSALKFCNSGGAALPVEVLRGFDERYKVNVLEGYGLSETSPVATFNVPWKEKKAGSIGEAIWGCEVRIFDDADRELPRGEVGELVIRGYNVMKGYYKRPEATEEAFRSGWFHSGDLGTMDEDGFIRIVDRKKDLIIRGGFNVYPREVEEVLYTHPRVREAAVVGVPHEKHGEEVKACISLHASDEAAPTEAELVAWSKKQLAASKYPRIFEILDELPKGSTGKILRRELR